MLLQNPLSALFAAMVLLLVSVASAADTNAVQAHLTASTFADTLKSHRAVVVMFYASWCSISQKLQKPFEDLHQEMLEADILLAKVDCIAEPDLYWQHDIKGFPMFGLFSGGESIYFEGEPSIDNIKQWALETAANTITELTPKVFYDLDLSTKPLAIEFQSEDSSAGASTKFDFACKKFSFPHCYTSRSTEFAALLGVSIPSTVIIKEFAAYASNSAPQEVIEVTTKAYASSNELLQWMQSVSFPPLVEHSEANANMLFFDKRPGFAVHLILFVSKKASAQAQAILGAAEAVGSDLMGRAVVAYVDCDPKLRGEARERAQNLMEDLEVTDGQLPTAAIIYSAGSAMKFYRLPEGTDVTKESLSHWMGQFEAKELVPNRVVGEEAAE